MSTDAQKQSRRKKARKRYREDPVYREHVLNRERQRYADVKRAREDRRKWEAELLRLTAKYAGWESPDNAEELLAHARKIK